MKWAIMALMLSGCASTTKQKVSLHLFTLEATSDVVQEIKVSK